MNQAEWLQTVAVAYEGDECLLWPGSLNWKGYGQVRFEGRVQKTHRVLCELAHGTPPHGAVAAHACNNRRCVNKRHLRWATPVENSADMVVSGNSTRGERQPKHRLTTADVIAIRNTTARTCDLARDLGVAESTIHSARTRKSWRHVC